MVSHASRRLELLRHPVVSIRKLLGWLLLSGCCGWTACWVLGWLRDADRWPLAQLQISGELQRINERDVRQALQGLMPLKSFMAQELQPIQQQLERLPWVAQASVRKQWPDRLIVQLREHQVVARWNDRQLLDNQGRCFVAPLDRQLQQQLPRFYAPKGCEQRLLAAWLAITPQVLPYGFKITSVVVNQHQAWQLVLNDKIHLLLGRDEHTNRLQRFLALYPLLMQPQAGVLSTIDLRYAHGAAISWVPSLPTQPLLFNQDRQ